MDTATRSYIHCCLFHACQGQLSRVSASRLWPAHPFTLGNKVNCHLVDPERDKLPSSASRTQTLLVKNLQRSASCITRAGFGSLVFDHSVGSLEADTADSHIQYEQGKDLDLLKEEVDQLTPLLEVVRNARLIACVTLKPAEIALAAARAALDGGISVLEVTLTTPSAIEVIATLVGEYPSAMIGGGTVLSLEDAEAVVEVGGKFIMSPVTDETLVRRFANGPALYIPGAMTPTEIFHAHSLGARVVKIFPITSLGGADYMRALQRPLSHIPFVPSQGIDSDLQIRDYIQAGATAVVLSDYLFPKPEIEMCHATGNLESIRERAIRTIEFINHSCGERPQ